LVALFNTYARLANSLSSIQKFRAMVEGEEVAEEKPKLAGLPDWATKPRHVVPAEKKALEDEGDGESECAFDEEETIGEAFNRELGKVIKAYKMVLQSWINFPRNV
jgi:hypothetical protein